MRDWLGNAKEIWLSPSPLGAMPSLRAKAAALRRNSRSGGRWTDDEDETGVVMESMVDGLGGGVVDLPTA